MSQSTEITQDIFCQDCGYNLRTLTGNRCPECGRSLAGLRSSVSQIPWVHRKEIGRIRAYWRTVWFVTIRTRSFGEEIARPVCYGEARRFQIVTVLMLFASLVVLILSAYLMHPPGVAKTATFAFAPTPGMVMGSNLAELAYMDFWPVAILVISTFPFLLAVTAAHTYFFHPATMPVEMQNRALALSFYGCAPLAIAVVLVPLIFDVIWQPDNPFLPSTRVMTALFAAALLTLAWLATIIRMAARIMPKFVKRRVVLGVSLLPIWILTGVLSLAVVPSAIILVLAVLHCGL